MLFAYTNAFRIINELKFIVASILANFIIIINELKFVVAYILANFISNNSFHIAKKLVTQFLYCYRTL